MVMERVPWITTTMGPATMMNTSMSCPAAYREHQAGDQAKGAAAAAADSSRGDESDWVRGGAEMRHLPGEWSW